MRAMFKCSIHSKLIILALISYSITQLTAQKEFAPKDGVWYENMEFNLTGSGPRLSYLEVIRVETDTMIQNKIYKKVDGQSIRQVDDKIYIWTGSEDKLLYDFNVEIGDTVSFTYPNRYNEFLSFEARTSNVEVVKYSGEEIKRITMSWLIDPLGLGDTFIYYEVFGSEYGLIPNGHRMLSLDLQVKWLRCYEDDDFSFKTPRFLKYGNLPCDYLTITKEHVKSEISVSIINHTITVSVENGEVPRDISLYSILGEIEAHERDKNVIDCPGKGIKILAVEFKNGIRYLQKVMVL